jgi:hypothetical protein
MADRGRSRPMKRLGERAQILPLIALSFIMLMGVGGLAVDAGYWEYSQREQQNATDAAALGGAQQLGHLTCPSQDAARSAAATDATANGFTPGGNVTLTIQNPPQSGPFAGNTCAVYAQITTTKVSSFFTRFFGVGQGATVSTQAVAIVKADNPGCFFLLNQSDTLNLNAAVILAPSCALYANSNVVETLGSVFTLRDFGYAHSIQENLLSLFLEAQPKQMLPVADPCPEITSCAYLAGNPPSTSGCQPFVNNSILPVTVQPGCYSDFENPLGIVNMASGTYVFTGPVENTGVLTGSGVTMYVSQTGGPVALNGSVDLLSPQTTGTYAGVLLYQVPGNANPVQFNASVNLSLAGLVYAPSAVGEILGQANVTFGQYVVFVLADAHVLAGITLTLPGPSNGQSLIKRAVLAE